MASSSPTPVSSVTSSNPSASPERGEEVITIPSTGLAYWEHRRACFLAGVPFPEPRTPAPFANPNPHLSHPSPAPSSPSPAPASTAPTPFFTPASTPASPASTPSPSIPLLPTTYTVYPPPPPATALPADPAPSVARLQALLDFDDPDVAWNGGVGGVHRNLTGGRRLAKRLRLGLVIKVLQAGWARDGTWPVDARGRPMPAPESPVGTAVVEGLGSVPPLKTV